MAVGTALALSRGQPAQPRWRLKARCPGQAASLASIFRPGSPAALGKLSPNAVVTRNGGRFGAARRAAPTQPDPALWPPADFDVLVQAFQAHGFRPACA